jgi:hypothetical protein
MKKNNGWISAKKMLPRLTAAERKSGSFGRQVLIYPPIQEPGCADQHTAFYGCRLTDEPAFYLHGRVIDVEWWQPLPEPPRERPVLNLTDDHRRLHLRQSEIEPTLVCVMLFVAERPVAYAHADVQRCQFSMSSDGPLFWAGDTNFLITEQERREIERFLWDCRPLLNAETVMSGRMNQVGDESREDNGNG